MSEKVVIEPATEADLDELSEENARRTLLPGKAIFARTRDKQLARLADDLLRENNRAGDEFSCCAAMDMIVGMINPLLPSAPAARG